MTLSYDGDFEFVQGDSFSLPLCLRDVDPNLPYPIDDPQRGYLLDENITLTARVIDSNKYVVAELEVVPYPHQELAENKGWALYKTDADTKLWPAGTAYLEIKTAISNSKRSTEMKEFLIKWSA